MNKYLFAIAVALVLVGAGCRKNVDETTTQGPIDVELVETSIAGYVFDETGRVISYASVTIGDETVLTNNRGIFLFQKKLLNKNGTLIKISSTGRYDAFKFVYPHVGTVNQVEIWMRAKAAPNTFNAGSEHTLEFASGDVAVRVTIPANAVGNQNGQPWTGTVVARTVAYDPTNTNDQRVIPGDFRAQDREGNARILQSFGMFGVELTTTSGVPLNLLPGQKAKISLKVPDELSSVAPTEIPLWHFNENNGYWEEEGSAMLVNGRYEGEVSHFSFWNCDVPNDFAFVKGRIVTPDGLPVAFTHLIIKSVTLGSTSGYSDNEGYFSGFVPANEPLEFQIGASCVNNTVEIGPFGSSSQNDIGPQTLHTAIFRYTGKLLSCDGTPLNSGVVDIEGDSSSFIPHHFISVVDENGEFNLYTNDCDQPTAGVARGYDWVNDLVSAPVYADIVGNQGSFGDIVVCAPLDEYIILELNGTTPATYNYKLSASLNYSFSDSLFLSGGYFGINNELQDIKCNITYTGNGASSGVLYHFYATIFNGNETFLVNCIDCRNDVVTFTELPTNVGDVGSGSLSGTALQTNSTGVISEVPYTIKFRVKRDQ